jgi:hypothetical protein
MPKDPEPFPFENRVGRGFAWGGMLTECDPGANPIDRPRLSINMRVRGGAAENRAGLSEFHAFTHRIAHLSDFHPATPLRLYILGDGLPGVSATTGCYVGHVDTEQDPEFQRATAFTGTSVVMGRFVGDLFVGVDAQLHQFQPLRAAYGTEGLLAAQSTPVGPAQAGTITFLQEFDGKLFLGLSSGAIVSYDGVTFTTELSGIGAPTCAAVYHAPSGGDALVVGFGTATNHIRYRVTGDAPGTWATVVPGAGNLDALDMAVMQDVLYIASADGDLWTYDGATLASAHTPTAATTMVGLAVRAGVLYFLWKNVTTAIVGKLTGGVYTDVVKSIGTLTPVALRLYREALWAAMSTGSVWTGTVGAPTGTWYELAPDAPVGTVFSLVVA